MAKTKVDLISALYKEDLKKKELDRMKKILERRDSKQQRRLDIIARKKQGRISKDIQDTLRRQKARSEIIREQQKQKILREARSGRRKEQVQNVKETAKKIGSSVKQGYTVVRDYKIKKTPAKFKKISKAVSYRKSLSSNLMNLYGGMGGTRTSSSQKRVKEGPGRPRGDYKHRDPQTGQPIPATVFYKRIKEVKRQAEQSARLRDIQAVQEMSKKGIPPSQAQQIVDARQLQSVGVQPQFQPQFQPQMQPQRIPNQISPEMQRQLFIQQLQRQQQPQGIPSQAVRPIWRRQNTQRYERDIFGNVKVVQGGNDPKNFWN